MVIEIKTAWEAAKEIADAVSKIVGIATKLKAAPGKAATELASALDEVTKTYRAVHDAITRYLSLVDDPHAFDNGIKPLLEIAAGPLSSEIAAGLGHCHRIFVAYDDHLNKWFARILDPTDAVLMKGAFDALSQADFGLFTRLASVGLGLDAGADEAIRQFHAGGGGVAGAAAARARLKDDFAALFDLRSELAKTMKSLRELQNEFRVLATGLPMD